MSNPPLFLPKKRKIAESRLTFLLGNCPLRFLAISFRLACNRNLPNPMRHFEQLVQILADTDELPIFRRDAAADLGDLGDPRAIPLLIDALADASALVRREAAKALGKLNDPRGTAPLLLALAKETDETTCRSMIETLGCIGTRDALPALTAMLESHSRIIQTEARKGIRQIQGRYPDILKPDVVPDKPTVPIKLHCPSSKRLKRIHPLASSCLQPNTMTLSLRPLRCQFQLIGHKRNEAIMDVTLSYLSFCFLRQLPLLFTFNNTERKPLWRWRAYRIGQGPI